MYQCMQTALQQLGLTLASEEGLNAENAARLISDLRQVVCGLSAISTLPALGLYLKEDELGDMRSQFADGSHIVICSEFDDSEIKGLANFTYRLCGDQLRGELYKGWVITEDGTVMSSEMKFERMNNSGYRPVKIKSVQLQVCRDEGLLSILPNSEPESYKYLLRNIAVMIERQTDRYLSRIMDKVRNVQDTKSGLESFRIVLG